MSRTNLFRAELDKVYDDGELQLGKGRGYAGEEMDRVHLVRQFGFHSHAPKGSHGIGITGSGERGLTAFLGLESPQHRPKKTEAGSTTIYDANGNAISIVEREMRVVHGKQHVIAVGGVTLTVTKDGLDIRGGKVTHDGKNIGADHKHGGVEAGSANTDVPQE
ncbi:phage baseplate assembly protein domain-containing protein [Methylobacterium frigidaeris]|uniref:Bacteriophage Mu Gp45 N-terminal domain-containing protein n=1 Tax=Methylobacterium frigidaeris TaxID=2038277 RepID=A0AA37HFZ7_9HYPH|nr:phage baseplate assembly protein [Methylobacterium frigidaeris]PIK74812.1 hypothetical protein CS379_00500 [Methylobacterium frigidaeris]GJD65180.1 hypothetical protein MPEAHAMD_5367 [Methylobacterium frigidaeris]